MTVFDGRRTADERRETAVRGPPSAVSLEVDVSQRSQLTGLK